MKLWLIRVIALLLALTLTGCELPSALEQALQQNTSVYPVTDEDLVAFPDMVYQRPQIAELEAYVDQTLATAQTGDVQATIDASMSFTPPMTGFTPTLPWQTFTTARI